MSLLRNLYWRFSKRNVPVFVKEKLRTKNLTKSQLEDLQFKKLKRVLCNAYQNIPYYRKAFLDIDFDPKNLETLKDFSALNFNIDKEIVRSNQANFFKEGVHKSDLSWHRTGGSTGTPLHFATCKLTDGGSQTSIMRALNWFGTEFGRKHVIFWGSPGYVIKNYLDYPKKILNIVRDKLMNRMFISNYDLSDENMRNYFDKIEQFQPEYIRGMSSSLYIFAKFMLNNKIEFSNNNIKVIHSACEQLFDWQKVVIEEAFCAPVVNTYGLSEVCDIAYGAPCGHLHISDEDVLVELIDTPLGKEIVTTQLNNLSCPLIRYRTGDLAESVDFGDCQYTTKVIYGLKGRAHDVIKCKGSKVIHGQAFTHVMVFIEGLVKYQIIQEELEIFHVKLVITDKAVKEVVEGAILEGFNRLVSSEVIVLFLYQNEIPLTNSGKHRWIISNVDK
jgi:phenylacetate-CoA ligase